MICSIHKESQTIRPVDMNPHGANFKHILKKAKKRRINKKRKTNANIPIV
jgi:hypothetical protein